MTLKPNTTIQFPIGSGKGNSPARVRDMMLLTRVVQRGLHEKDKADIEQARLINGARLIQLK